jgi:hypothetical protein
MAVICAQCRPAYLPSLTSPPFNFPTSLHLPHLTLPNPPPSPSSLNLPTSLPCPTSLPPTSPPPEGAARRGRAGVLLGGAAGKGPGGARGLSRAAQRRGPVHRHVHVGWGRELMQQLLLLLLHWGERVPGQQRATRGRWTHLPWASAAGRACVSRRVFCDVSNSPSVCVCV